MAHLRDEIDLPAAVEAGKLETRQYVKRQEVWLKRNMIAWKSL
jgi:tRNA dimethylallyltransferase